jgi:hypothetical protein
MISMSGSFSNVGSPFDNNRIVLGVLGHWTLGLDSLGWSTALVVDLDMVIVLFECP